MRSILALWSSRIRFFPFKKWQCNSCDHGFDPVPAAGFGFIQAHICPPDQRFWRIPVLVCSDAKTCRHFTCAAKGTLLKVFPQPFGQFDSLFPVGVCGQDQELVASPASEWIGGADGLPQLAGHFLQDFIPGIMPESIVDVFKPVQVEQ